MAYNCQFSYLSKCSVTHHDEVLSGGGHCCQNMEMFHGYHFEKLTGFGQGDNGIRIMAVKSVKLVHFHLIYSGFPLNCHPFVDD